MRTPRSIAALSLVTLLSGAAAAQGPSRVEATVRVRQAELAARRGDLAEARRLLELALQLGAPPTAERELARVLESQGALRAAGAAWSRYAALATDAPDRETAATQEERLRRTLGELLVEVTPAAAGRVARVWVDRDAPRPYPAGGLRAVVEGGAHRVRVEARGYATWEAMLTTGFGEPAVARAAMRVGREP